VLQFKKLIFLNNILKHKLESGIH